MKIAVIGSGISGLVAARRLSRNHDIALFEAADRLGGHTATYDVEVGGRDYAVDTGFIVYNERTYPRFSALLAELGVATQATEMSFSVSCRNGGLEYAGSNLNTLFAQRRNLFSGYFHRLWLDIVRFNRAAVRDLQAGRVSDDITLGEYLAVNGYGRGFRDHYLVPMTAAIWSTGHGTALGFPLKFFVQFFRNHGLLSLTDRPQWRSVVGGSHRYIEPLVAPFVDRIRRCTPIVSIERRNNGVRVHTAAGATEVFDQVVIATHSDQALAMLADASAAERDILGAVPYLQSEVVLHTDERLLPQNRRCWSSWNAIVDGSEARPALTYNMNILQRIDAPVTFCVTLNQTDAIDPRRILGVYHYSHPQFSLAAIAAQRRAVEINGVNRTWFCGAYWFNGFHEDGVASAQRVADAIETTCKVQSTGAQSGIAA